MPIAGIKAKFTNKLFYIDKQGRKRFTNDSAKVWQFIIDVVTRTQNNVFYDNSYYRHQIRALNEVISKLRTMIFRLLVAVGISALFLTLSLLFK